ncbi:MAG: hypothetical protein IKU85_10765 [Bacteroidaceae bacterium]|nr:hypothetical protein [Bacteroidaceae bacterium]
MMKKLKNHARQWGYGQQEKNATNFCIEFAPQFAENDISLFSQNTFRYAKDSLVPAFLPLPDAI